MRTLLAALAVAAVTAIAPANAQGQNSRFCAEYGGGVSNCGFSTIQQCRATIAGFNRGTCFLNPQYPGDQRRHR